MNIANFLRTVFYKITPLAASALNSILYFQVVNAGYTILSQELLVT